MENLFSNIGEKIKTLAKVVFLVGIIVFVISGLVTSIELGNVMHGFAFLVFLGSVIVGFITTYISSMFLYGFGELISNSQKLVDNGYSPQMNNSNSESINNSEVSGNSSVVNDTIKAQPDTNKSTEIEAVPGSDEWKCPKCGIIHRNYVGTCGCGEKKP